MGKKGRLLHLLLPDGTEKVLCGLINDWILGLGHFDKGRLESVKDAGQTRGQMQMQWTRDAGRGTRTHDVTP